METYWTCLLFFFGISVGSFVNMLLYRTELRYKLRKNLTEFKNLKNKDRSFCDFCGKQLSWYENIPIISWLWLGGRSRCCYRRLPYQYLVVEIGMGILFSFIIYHLSFIIDWNLPIHLIIVSLLVFSAVFDVKHMILPDFSTYILVGCSVALWMFNNFGDYSYLFSGFGAFLFLLILHLATRGKGMGMGDVKYVVFMGILLGVAKTILAFYLAFIGGAVVGLILIIFLKKKKNSRMPFGPFLIMATLICWFWGEKLLLYFYRWF